MDLNTVVEVVSPAGPGQWRPGDAWLGGGTALFGEPRPHVTRLLDLTTAGWPALTLREDGLEIAATCTIAELAASGYDIAERCCHAFLASFKIWNVATVGGNLCAALPAGPMIALGAALDGTVLLQGPEGGRTVGVAEFVTGEGATVLRDGELLRSMFLPASALAAVTAYRQGSLHAHGRSGVLVIGRRDADATTTLTVTAATRRPYVLRFPEPPSAELVSVALTERIGEDAYIDDVHGLPAWRRHLTRLYAEQIRAELA
ncbi:FAD binding domain-containing protein [Paractinoplanes brasiliensis]|uniref:CO/xanthine dehydrogenase FAD-binding subunit n=1 Tax=Paractinoplanes brasiliensis TaxID=52695 RepID=A0A4R6K039_9ACTN|nr:FAD binding domain-containing protein [Actinoplanes brasiliensis]TDO42514.1 CO/xanthine dehydrogenase FAD-binding subunit [Actinoplanes brasiliensis]GID31382.1 FAD-binding molybdopterin dehydrogenase [Actinoplanes brasiliensis]